MKEDLPYGRSICEAMCPFVEHLIARGLKDKTVRNHMDNLWILGGEIIRDISTFGKYDIPAEQSLKDSVGPDGGPYCRHLQSESEENSFNATCRKLHRFLEA